MRQKKIDFGASLIQYYKVYCPCKTSKPSAESLESIAPLSSNFLRYYRWHCSPCPR